MGFLAAFLAAGFLAAFFAAGFLAAFFAEGFLAAFLAGFFLTTFLALGFLALTAFFSTAASLNEQDPFLPATAADTTFLATINLARARRTRTAALPASTLLFATTCLRMAWREDPFLSPSPLIAAAIMVANGGWTAGVLGLVTFLTLGAGAAATSAIIRLFCVSFVLTPH